MVVGYDLCIKCNDVCGCSSICFDITFFTARPLRGFDLVKDRDTGNSKGYGFCVYQVQFLSQGLNFCGLPQCLHYLIAQTCHICTQGQPTQCI